MNNIKSFGQLFEAKETEKLFAIPCGFAEKDSGDWVFQGLVVAANPKEATSILKDYAKSIKLSRKYYATHVHDDLKTAAEIEEDGMSSEVDAKTKKGVYDTTNDSKLSAKTFLKPGDKPDMEFFGAFESMKHIVPLDEITHLPKKEGEVKLFNTHDSGSKKNVKVGDKHTVDYSSGPFGGRETFEITRIENNGDVFGVSIEGGAYELDPEDVI